MPTSYPSGIDSYTNKVNGTVIDASHVNNLQDPVVALETIIGQNPLTISDTTTPGPNPTFLGGRVNGVNIGLASMIATQLRLITGQAAWWTNPGTSLAALNAGKLPIPGGSTTGDILYYNGTSWVRLPIGTAGQFLDVSGGIPAWVTPNAATLGVIPAPGSPVLGDLLYYNGSAWVRLPIGTANQLLTVSGGIPAWVGSVPGSLNAGQWTAWNAGNVSVDLKLRSPAVVSSGGVVTEYANIGAAITAAGAGEIVVVPPGTYSESIVVKANAIVTELIPGTVTISRSGSVVAVEVQDNASIFIDSIVGTGNSGAFPVGLYFTGTGGLAVVRRIAYTGGGAHLGVWGSTTGTNRLIVDAISIVSATDGSTGIANLTSAGTLSVWAHSVVASGGATSYGVDINAGVLNLYSGAYSGGNYDMHQTGGTLNLSGCQFDVDKTLGTLTFLEGDREPTGNPNIVAGRLTLTSGTPVTEADVTAATTVYYTPYRGDHIALYHGGSVWDTHTFAELSIGVSSSQTGTRANGVPQITGLTSTAKLTVGMEISGTGVSGTILSIDSATQVTSTANSTGAGSTTVTFKIPASKKVDIFAYDNPTTTVNLAFGPLWTNDATRATALTTLNGVQVLTGSYSVGGTSLAQGRLRYLGTIRTTTTAGQTEDSMANRYVLNAYNNVLRTPNVAIYTCSGALTLTNAAQDIAGVTTGAFTPAVDEYAEVELAVRFLYTGGTASCNVNDVLVSQLDLVYSSADHLQTLTPACNVTGVAAAAVIGGDGTAVGHFKLALSAGVAYEIKAQALNNTGNRGRVGTTTQIKVRRYPQGQLAT